MSLADLAGTGYGPFAVPVESIRVADFVAATGDDPERWGWSAPPGYAAVVLFAAVPDLLGSATAAPFTRTLIHTDQSFTWHRPIAAGSVLDVTARVASVRERGDLNFVGFDVIATAAGEEVLGSTSTFLMSASAAGEPPPDAPEPAPEVRGPCDPARPLLLPAPGGDLPALARSAARIDLLRYAAATGDWNPIHWDHAAARAAGLPGIVVHGLLMAAWVAQAAARFSTRDDPLASMQLRLRRPLTAAAAATVAGKVDAVADDRATLGLEVVSGGDRLVTGRAVVRAG